MVHDNLHQILEKWDKGNASDRKQILVNFQQTVDNFTTEDDLETYLNLGGSLFLVRLLVSVQLKYTCPSYDITLHLKTLKLFVDSFEGDRYAAEIIEGGALLTFQDMILRKECHIENKILSVELLISISKRGGRYKESIVESHSDVCLRECIFAINMKPVKQSFNLDEPPHQFFENETKHLNIALKKEMTYIRKLEKHMLLEHETKRKKVAEEIDSVDDLKEELPLPRTSLEAPIGVDEDVDVLKLTLWEKLIELVVTLTCDNPKLGNNMFDMVVELIKSEYYSAQAAGCKILKVVLVEFIHRGEDVVEPLLSFLGEDNDLVLALVDVMVILLSSPARRILLSRLVNLARSPFDKTSHDDVRVSQVNMLMNENLDKQSDALYVLTKLIDEKVAYELLFMDLIPYISALVKQSVHSECQRRSARLIEQIGVHVPRIMEFRCVAELKKNVFRDLIH